MGVQVAPGKSGINDTSPDAAYDVGTNIPATTDRDGIALAQVRTGAGVLVLAGAGVSGGVYSAGFDGGRKVTVYSGGNLSALTFTIAGTDKDGATLSENITGPNNTTVTTTGYFQTVTSVSVGATIGTNVEIGFAASLLVLNMNRGNYFKVAPANSEVVKLALYGEVASGYTSKAKLVLVNPASITLTFADGTTPSDTRIYFPGGTEPTPTASGTDIYEFTYDGTAASGDHVWFATVSQDFKP